MNFHEMEANAVREKHETRFFSFRGRFIYTIDPLPEVSALGKCENCVKNFWSVADTQSSHRSHKSLSHWWRHQIWFICVQTECLRYSKKVLESNCVTWSWLAHLRDFRWVFSVCMVFENFLARTSINRKFKVFPKHFQRDLAPLC